MIVKTTFVDLNEMPLVELFEYCAGADSSADEVIRAAIEEDLGAAGDLTSAVLIEEARTAEARIRSRRSGRLAAVRLLPRIAQLYDAALRVELIAQDGAVLAKGDTIATIGGPLRSMLAAERVMLNFLTHLSGIATVTSRYVDAVAGTKAKIYDTRKTVPGMRRLAKYAVRCGGGYCHRMGLYDAMLVKDNHIAHLAPNELEAALRAAIESARRQAEPWFVEVEVDTLEQLRTVLRLDVDIVLLDNMRCEQMRQAVAIRNDLKPAAQLEASGGVDLDSVRAIAETGVDRIAIGALTHSAPALDIGMDIQ